MHPRVYTYTSWISLGSFISGMETLVDAVDSGDPNAVGLMVGAIGDDEAAEQLSALRTNDSHQLETIIMLTALGGDVEMFHAVLRPLRRILAESQVLCVGKADLLIAVTAREMWRKEVALGANLFC